MYFLFRRMSTLEYYRFASPIGRMEISATEHGVLSVLFTEEPVSIDLPRLEPLRLCLEQLQEYFAGTRASFEGLPLSLVGTTFDAIVWEAVIDVPFGQTETYGAVARAIGKEKASRAVGGAVGRNTLCIIVPCHRIVAAGGSGGGYAWGVWRKKWLLNHERREALKREEATV